MDYKEVDKLKRFIAKNHEKIDTIKNMNDDLLVILARANPACLFYNTYPLSDCVKINLVLQNPRNIQYFANKSNPAIDQLAFDMDFETIMYIKNPTDEMIEYTIEKKPTLIHYIDRMSYDIQKKAIKDNLVIALYIRNPHPEIERAFAKDFMKNEDDKLWSTLISSQVQSFITSMKDPLALIILHKRWYHLEIFKWYIENNKNFGKITASMLLQEMAID